jgi:hypothetical protein
MITNMEIRQLVRDEMRATFAVKATCVRVVYERAGKVTGHEDVSASHAKDLYQGMLSSGFKRTR